MDTREVPQQPIQTGRSFNRFRGGPLRSYLSLNDPNGETLSQKEDAGHRDPEKDEENIAREIHSLTKRKYDMQRFPLMPMQDENCVMKPEVTTRVLGNQSAKKPQEPELNLNLRRRYLRRSCAPNFMHMESLPERDGNANPYGGCIKEPSTTSFSSVKKSSQHQGETENVPLKITGSGLKSRFRRRSVLQRHSRDSETKQNDDAEDGRENNEGSASRHERNGGDEERRTGLMSSHFTESTMKVDNEQKEEANEQKSEKKSRFASGLGRSHWRRSSILEIMRQPTALAAVPENRLDASVRQRSGNRLCFNEGSSDLRSGTSERKDPVLMGQTERTNLLECCRELKFDSGDEGEEPEDHTAPLTLFAQTPILNRASVLQNPFQNKLQKVHEPIIKKSLFDETAKANIKRRRRSIQISQQLKDQSRKPSIFGTCSSNNTDTSSGEQLLGVRKEPEKIGHPTITLGNTLLKEEEEPSTSSCSKIKGNFPLHSISTKRVQRRRSAAVLCIRTPMKRRSGQLETKSSSKLTGSMKKLSKLPVCNESQKRPKLRRSLIALQPSLSHLRMTDKIGASDTDCSGESKMQTSMESHESHKVDAATNTSINLAKIKLVDLKILEDIEALLKEQNELNAKAVQVQERTTARRLEMKEKGLMESFMTSISPLRRLKAIFSENTTGKESPHECDPVGEGESEGDAGKDAATMESPHPDDQSKIEWKSPKVPLHLTQRQIQWRRRQQDNRLTRTYQEPSTKEEKFLEAWQGSTSPFTTMVGDCERPSLAPMTPHSRQDLLCIKLSLKKQLENLYD